jgi:hypothetical protein
MNPFRHQASGTRRATLFITRETGVSITVISQVTGRGHSAATWS